MLARYWWEGSALQKLATMWFSYRTSEYCWTARRKYRECGLPLYYPDTAQHGEVCGSVGNAVQLQQSTVISE
jgi:hypothetical protein